MVLWEEDFAGGGEVEAGGGGNGREGTPLKVVPGGDGIEGGAGERADPTGSTEAADGLERQSYLAGLAVE